MNELITMPAAEYHADPCEQPSLSSSIAHLLCTSSPAHARTAHPRLNPMFEREEEQHFDIGTAAHQLLLDGSAGDVVVVLADDWRTKAAKEQRDEARAQGRLPLLEKHYLAVEAMVNATRDQLTAIDTTPGFFVDGTPEQTLIWEDEGVTCRCRFDWIHSGLRTVDDFKSTSRSANPEQWARALFGFGADVQVAFYLRGLEQVFGLVDVEWRFVVAETFPPYALSVVSLAPDVLTLARKKVDYARTVWRRCLERGEWPAYPTQVCWAELPPWEESRWLAREERELVRP